MDSFDSCVIGAGVVGLAIARKLALTGKSVIVVEQAESFGSGISSRNSEVIHAGIYYPAGSLKAKMCVQGNTALYEYCAARNVSHNKIGKLIVATDKNQYEELEAIKAKAANNGVCDLTYVEQADIERLEPHINASLALLSPSTGIIDVHELMASFATDIENAGGLIAYRTKFIESTLSSTGHCVSVTSDDTPFTFDVGNIVNAGGLHAQSIAERIEGVDRNSIPRLHLCRGCYFTYSGKSPVKRLVYPVPEKNTTGLGIHATVDLAGQMRFGPDTTYVDDEDYSVPIELRSKFASAVRKYLPSIDESRLQPGYAGLRPKLQAQGDSAQDFDIHSSGNGIVNLFGIESPGLTSCMAIAEEVLGL